MSATRSRRAFLYCVGEEPIWTAGLVEILAERLREHGQAVEGIGATTGPMLLLQQLRHFVPVEGSVRFSIIATAAAITRGSTFGAVLRQRPAHGVWRRRSRQECVVCSVSSA
ncbi:MAG: hypothetical protein HOW59_04285 [Nonomuraea sp.]|nr:hypothetical protein [Nonomuraea sp.]